MLEMGEREEAAASSQVTRVFIGGLSASVTAADLEKTFASLGRVDDVEFVRTDGRSFAYMDFEPNSDKALAKLFSTYNGCTWKGGKLRLEKAREHYLARLKREWAEDEKLATPVTLDTEKNAENQKKLEYLNQEKMQLRIFFPKLRKMKTLSFKGTGKHKYSFQRIEVPPLPIHFCDCEEHCESSKSQEHLSSLNSVAYEKERSIMTSVMNKLFEKEENEMAASGMIKLAENANTMDLSNNDIQVKETEEIQEADADNLVTNIGLGQSDDMLAQLRGREAPSVDQELRFGKPKSFNNKLMGNKARSQKQQKTALIGTSEVVLNQESGPSVAGKTAGDAFTSILARNKVPEGHQEMETFAEAPAIDSQTELKTSTAEPRGSRSWIQKSSWKDLVGGSGNSSFSISHVLPGVSSLAKLPETSDSAAITSSSGKPKSFKNKLMGNKARSQKQQKTALIGTSEVVLNQESGPSVAGKTAEDAFTSILARNKVPEGHQEMETFAEAPAIDSQTELKTSTAEPRGSHSWIQKSSWKDLVGGSGNSSFSISHVLPGVSSLAKPPETSDSAAITSASGKKRKVQSEAGCSTSLDVKQNIQEKQDAAPRLVELPRKGDRNEAFAEDGSGEPNGEQQHKRTIPKVNIGEVCTFMRSAESEKQWTKAKSVVSGYLKTKSNENKASKLLKGT